MRTNPLLDGWQFILGLTEIRTGDGVFGHAFFLFFIVLLGTALAVALINWREDPAQRERAHVITCACRILMGCLWFQACLWQLPLPVSEGFRLWTERMAQYAAFDLHRQLVVQLYLPHLQTLGPLVFLAELSFAVSLILGFGVPLFAMLAAGFSLHLWLALYLDPNAPPWAFVLLAIVHTLFVAAPAGRSLGLDALLHRRDVTGFRRAFG
jgi:hypothetical protein